MICPDETALYIPARRALACADGVVRLYDSDELRFVPDELMDDPEETKAGLATPTGACSTSTSTICCWRTAIP